MSRVIVCFSGGLSSAYCAKWALDNYQKEEVILYFNDTKWEHPDLYRFMDDVSSSLGLEITVDSDGRNPEKLFYDNNALANNRMPFCSRILKAERLQSFVVSGDIVVFGIDNSEVHRAERITAVYQTLSAKKNIDISIRFPLVEYDITKTEIQKWLDDSGIKIPEMYEMGFTHNNCHGGCVRAGKKQWKLLLEKYPDIYADRERVEKEVSDYLGKSVTFMKGESLSDFRSRCESGLLSRHYFDSETEYQGECMGVCSLF